VDYTRLSPSEIRDELQRIGDNARDAFGSLDARQLNWKPDPSRWSVAQCLEHLVTADRLMTEAASRALDPASPRTIWQRLPFLPALLGTMMVRSQAPGGTRKFVAPSTSRPATSDISPDVLDRFVAQHRVTVEQVQRLDAARAERTIMTSPFVGVITYSVLDGWRLMVAHDHRHIEQAQRVRTSPGFPGA